jgi:hypothetical protein
MALISNTGTLTITSAASTTLGGKAGTMSANSWDTITISNQLLLDPFNVGDPMTSYSPKCAWDPGRSLLRFGGGVHGGVVSAPRHYIGTYTDSSNAWTPTTPINIVSTSSTTPSHEYYAFDTDHTNGNVYALTPFIGINSMRVYNNTTGTWSNPYPTNTHFGANTPCAAVVYHPGLYGGTGGVLVASNRGIWSLDPRAGSPVWNIILDRTNEVNAMLEFPAGVYDPFTSSAYMGDTGGMWRVQTGGTGNRGTASQIAQPPISVGPSSHVTGVLIACGSNPMVVMHKSSGSVSQYNGTSWSTVSTSVPPALLGAFDNHWAAGGCTTYGCTIFIKAANPTQMSTTMHIWKR